MTPHHWTDKEIKLKSQFFSSSQKKKKKKNLTFPQYVSILFSYVLFPLPKDA